MGLSFAMTCRAARRSVEAIVTRADGCMRKSLLRLSSLSKSVQPRGVLWFLSSERRATCWWVCLLRFRSAMPSPFLRCAARNLPGDCMSLRPRHW